IWGRSLRRLRLRERGDRLLFRKILHWGRCAVLPVLQSMALVGWAPTAGAKPLRGQLEGPNKSRPAGCLRPPGRGGPSSHSEDFPSQPFRGLCFEGEASLTHSRERAIFPHIAYRMMPL